MARRLKPKEVIAPKKSLAPDDAQIRPSTKAKRFAWSDPKYGTLQNDIYETFQAALQARSNKLADLAVFNSLYELEHSGEPDSPWVGASDVIPPIIPAEAEALRDYIIMAVFSPHLFLASTPITEEQQFAPHFERWLNRLLPKRRHTGESWAETLLSMIQASARDGTSGVMATWERRERDVPTFSWTDKINDQGLPELDDDDRPKREVVRKTIKEITREPKVQLLISKDVYLLPAESKSFNSTLCSVVNLWMTEEELLQLADGMGDNPMNGVFSRDALEIVFSYNPNGTTDVPNDPEGSWDKDEGGQLDVGVGQGSQTGETFRNRGPFLIRLCMSMQHDMNGDGRVERNWFWLHDLSQTLIGWMPYEYMMDQWPCEFFSMFPRVNQFDGYSIPERLADLVDSKTAAKNARINFNDMAVSPILIHKSGADQRNKNMTVRPMAMWEADNPKDDFAFLQLPQVGQTSFQEDSQDDAYVAKITGQAAPFTGGQGPTRQTATQAKQAATAQSTRSAVIALWFRFFLRRFIAMVMSLYRQYADEGSFNPPELQGLFRTDPQSGQKTPVKPYEVLMMHWEVDVAGIADPVDAVTKRNDMATWLEQITKVYPARFGQPEAQYEAVKSYTEQAFPNIANTEAVLGTADDAKKLGEQMRKIQAQQMQKEQQGQGGGAGGGQ